MKIKKTLAGVLAGSVLAGMALLGAAAPASASDEGAVLPGAIYWFTQYGSLASQDPANQLFGGVNAASGGQNVTGRPFLGLTTENACPATTTGLFTYVRIPQVGVPENDWAQVQVGLEAQTKDADGRFYTTTVTMADRLNKAEIMAYNLANGGSGTYPYISVCRDTTGLSLGYFATTLTVTGTVQNTLTWSLATPAYVAPTTTTVAASAAATEAGTPVTLTATVAPATATTGSVSGDVEFFAGATSLGTGTVASGVATLTTSAVPVGTNGITAEFVGSSSWSTSTSAPVSLDVTAPAARTTTTTLAVDLIDGEQYSAVTLASTVVASTGAANGTVIFKDGPTVLGSVPVTAGVVPVFTTNVLSAGTHSLTAEFVGTAPYTNSASAAVQAVYINSGPTETDEQTVTVEIPAGAITITTPYTPAAPLALGIAALDPSDSTFSASAPFTGIVITDTRAGNLGFTASVVSGPFVSAKGSFPAIHAGLTGLVVDQLVGNALQAPNVVVSNHVPFVDGLDVPKVFATYAAGQTIGTAQLHGVFGVDQVPTSVAGGLYTSTVTFTVA